MVFTHSGATGRRTLLVDANPGIITLPTAHSMEFEEYLREQERRNQEALEEPPADPPTTTTQTTAPTPPQRPRARHALPRGANPRSPGWSPH